MRRFGLAVVLTLSLILVPLVSEAQPARATLVMLLTGSPTND
jgi:hypothetical protein